MDTNFQELPGLVATASSDANLPNLLAQTTLHFGESTASPSPASTVRNSEDTISDGLGDASNVQASTESATGQVSALIDLPSLTTSAIMESNSESLSANTRSAENRAGDSASRSLAGLILLRYSNLSADRVEGLIASVRRGMGDSQSNTIHVQSISSTSPSTQSTSGTSTSMVQPTPTNNTRPHTDEPEGPHINGPSQRATDRATLLAQATTSRGRRVLERVRNPNSDPIPAQNRFASMIQFGSSTFAQNRASSSALLAHLERQHGSISPRPRPSDDHTHEYVALERLVARLRRSRELAARTPRERGLDLENTYASDNTLRYSDLSDIDQSVLAVNTPYNRPPETRRSERTFTFSEGRLSRSEPDLEDNRALSEDGTRGSQTFIRRRINDAGLSLPVHRSAGTTELQPSAEPEGRGVRVRLRVRGQDSQSGVQYLSFADPAPGEPQSSTLFSNLNLPRQVSQNGRSRTRGWARVDPNGDDIATEDEGEHPRSESFAHRENNNGTYQVYDEPYDTVFESWHDKPVERPLHHRSDPTEGGILSSQSIGGTHCAEFSPSPLPTKLSEMMAPPNPSIQHVQRRSFDRTVPSRTGQLIGR